MDSRYLDLLSDWHPVLPVRELGATPVELRLYDKEIVLYRGSDGQPHALNNRCPHRKMRLALGRVSGDSIVCPYHGWSFAPDGSGKAPACPNMRVSTTCYSVRTHQGMLWLRHGETEAPPLPALEYEGYRPLARLFHRIDAPLDLLLDNMTELEHTASVHSIFGFDADRMSDVLTSACTSTTKGRSASCPSIWNGSPEFRAATASCSMPPSTTGLCTPSTTCTGSTARPVNLARSRSSS